MTSKTMDGFCERDKLNAIKFNRWFVAFSLLVVLGAIVLGPIEGSLSEPPLWRWALAFLPIVPGYFALAAYFQFIKVADELIERVHYEAASKGFVVVIIAGFILNLAAQILGQWEDSGAILWFLGITSYVVSVRNAWRAFDV